MMKSPLTRRRLGIAMASILTAGLAVSATAAANATGPIPTGAVEDLSFCTQNTLAAVPFPEDYEENHWSEPQVSSPEIELPFSVNYYGTEHNSIFVNPSGTLTFGDPWEGYIWGGSSDYPDAIAAFDTMLEPQRDGSSEITYGVSADGSAFCANWVNVAPHEATDTSPEKLLSFQTIIRDRSALTGGVKGDVDVTFNYDQLPQLGAYWWNGEVPATAQAGLFVKDHGWTVRLPGSDGRNSPESPLLDDGEFALTAGSANALDQQGRYIFALRDGDSVERYDLTGTVRDASGNPLAGAVVSVGNKFATTAADGTYRISAVYGSLSIRVNPPANTDFVQGFAWANVDGADMVQDFVLKEEQLRIPRETTVTQGGRDAAAYGLYWSLPFDVTHSACEGAESVTLEILKGGNAIYTGDLVESSPGQYAVTVPPLYPTTGIADFRITVDCGDGTTQNVEFDLYIDPAGTILDTEGNAIDGATVTLLRSDFPEGDFSAVADGSAIMSPSNRTNPTVTGEDGRFAWDVIPGYYRVEASAPNCTVPGSAETVVSTEVLPVPPEYLDLELVLECAEAPVTPPVEDEPAISVSVSEAEQGGTVTVTGAGFDSEEAVEIWLHSTPALLATPSVTSEGAFVHAVTIPTATEPGLHSIVVKRADGTSVTTSITVTKATVKTPGGSNGGGSNAGGSNTGGSNTTPGGSAGGNSTTSSDGLGTGSGLATTGAAESALAAALAIAVLLGGVALLAVRRVRES
ncbi:carboxypeptidase-like regulatory domain-containing protein [Lysinibacter cavernae]|uniref:Gram-positive cocci surface proteins LPxTG domain-containing protein n=1 Tax=Lysinibacter cavernae TaxID=1640652 RepID=A0A7X5R2D8_9MICO|nr:carboxypeptidase-like regulatory domain-containing protein [Lysinibacter cavernae]NIH54420.1 hypothetical protein [Lysinibacter cavernae]